MNTDELKKLLDEYRFKKLQTYIAKDVYSEGFQACEKLLWPLVEALEFTGWIITGLSDVHSPKDLIYNTFVETSDKANKTLSDLEQKLKGEK